MRLNVTPGICFYFTNVTILGLTLQSFLIPIQKQKFMLMTLDYCRDESPRNRLELQLTVVLTQVIGLKRRETLSQFFI